MGFVAENKIKILGGEWMNFVERYGRNRREKLERELVATEEEERERGGL